MNEETENGTQTLDSFPDTIELRFRHLPEMDNAVTETSSDELPLRSVDERIKQATHPILRRVEELCALLAVRTEMESAGNSETSGLKRNQESISPAGNRHDKKNTRTLNITNGQQEKKLTET